MKRNIIVLVAFFLFLILFVQKNIIQINNNWAVVDFENGKIIPAIKKFKNAIKYKGQKNIIKYNLANANFKISNHEEAKKLYMELLQNTDMSNSLKSEIYFNIGNIAFMYENYEEALENYYMALLLNSEDTDVKFNIEMIEYMNRPIIYNNEILLLPRKKIEGQLSSVEEIDSFEIKVNDYILKKFKDYQSEYSKISKDMSFKQKYLSEISKTEYEKLKASKAAFDANNKFGDSRNNRYYSTPTNVLKETDKNKNYIISEFSELRKNKNIFENCMKIIVKEVLSGDTQSEQKEKLQKILLSFTDKYKDKADQFSAVYDFIFKDKQNKANDREENNNLCVRSSIYKINQLQYESSVDNNSKILSRTLDLINLINNSLTELNAGEQKDLKVKMIELTSAAGDMYIQEQFVNYEDITSVFKQILIYENEFSEILNENEKKDDFIKTFDMKLSKNADYDEYIKWQNKILWYKERIDILYMIYEALIEQSIDNFNNAESFKNIIKIRLSEKFTEKKDILNSIKNIFPDSSQHAVTLKQQKQICKEIQISRKNKIGMIFKIFLNRFYFYKFQFNKDNLESNARYFNSQLSSFKEKEEYAKNKKNEMNVIAKEMQEIQERAVYLKENKHMYVNFKESNAILEKEKTAKQIKMKQTELMLLDNIKGFIKNFIVNAEKKSEDMKNNIGKIKAILQQIVKINEFEQESIKDAFLKEKMELESEMIKFEKEKEYINSSVAGQNSSHNVQGQALIAKSLYQKEKLDSLFIREREITNQIKELQYLTGQLSETEQHELDMLEKDLVEKQLSLVKYYLTVENDNTKKNLTRNMMQSLYKTQYDAEQKNNNYAVFDESKGTDITRKAVLQIYKSSIDQLREFNRLIYRMKIINAILELEYIKQLTKQIEMNAGDKNVSSLKKELQISITKEMQNKVLELEKISDISKENITFAKYLKESIEAAKEKQKKEKERIFKEEKANLTRKLHILNEKANMLEEFIKNNDYDVTVDMKKIKAELKDIKKETKLLAASSKEIEQKIILLKKENTSENNMSSIIQSADLISSNISADNVGKKKNGKENEDKDKDNLETNNNAIRKTDVNRILASYSNSEKVSTKKVKIKEHVKNDW